MKIVLDGYNVAHRLPGVRDQLKQSLEKGRIALESHLITWKKLKNFSGSITIVYDGQQSGNIERSHGIDYIFTSSRQEADDRIIQIIRDSNNPGDVIVVSDDNKVRNGCKSLGARVETASYLVLQRSKPSKRSREKNVDPSLYRITEELKRKWGA